MPTGTQSEGEEPARLKEYRAIKPGGGKKFRYNFRQAGNREDVIFPKN